MLDEDQMQGRLRELLRDPQWSVAPRPGVETRIRAAARRQRLRAASVAAAVAAVLAVAVVLPLNLLSSGGHQQPPVRALAGATGRSTTIIIDPQAGEKFAPAPAADTAKLTAQQAWAHYMRHLANPRTGIPANTHAALGLLTLPAGPADAPGSSNLSTSGGQAHIALGELAYGYSAPSACMTINPRLVAPPNARCVSWTFLNADTGQQIDSTYQKVGNWHWRTDPHGL